MMMMMTDSWIEAIIPCLGRRKATSSAVVKGNPNSLPRRYEDGLELAQTLAKPGSVPSTPVQRIGITTTIIAELPSESSPKKLSRFKSTRSVRSIKSTKSMGSQARKTTGKKQVGGKRKRAQTITISAPTNFRHIDGAMPRLPQPIYPSPSRKRPENLTMDARDPSLEDEKRPQTAPLESTSQSRESFPLRSGSLSLRSHHAWKLESLPPMPALDVKVDEKVEEEDNTSDSAPMKRKPVPIRTRAASNPVSPTHIPKSFAAEMLGSVPSPVELEAPHNPIAELESKDTKKRKGHSAMTSLSSIGSPTLARFSSRLSTGALNILTSFPTTPRPAKAEPKVRRSQSQPRLRSDTVVTVSSPDTSMMPKALSLTKKQLSKPSSPRDVSPRPKFPTAIDVQDLLQHDPSPFFNKSLPPTPKSMGFDKGRFISIASGLEYDDFLLPATPTFDLDLNGKKTWIEGVERGSDAESIHIFLAASRAPSPRRSPALA